MKNLIFLFVFSIFISSCSKTDDDTDLGCTSNCTTIAGKFISVNNAPVSNVRVTLNYRESSGGFGSHTRKIVDVKSDANGEFNSDFYIQDNELGNALGYFLVGIDDSKLDVNRYIRTNNLIGNTTSDIGFAIYDINHRDTIISQNFYIPKKAYIKVNLNNFIPQQSGDRFEVQTLYPFGPEIGYNEFLDSPYSTGFSGYDNFVATTQNNLLNVFVAEGEKNIIRINKIKNGVASSEDFPINVPANNTIVLTYTF